MAYESGTALDAVELLDKLETFVAANGYTVNNYSTILSTNYNAGKVLNIAKGGRFLNLRSFIKAYNLDNDYQTNTYALNGIVAYGSVGYDPAATRWYQNDSFTTKLDGIHIIVDVDPVNYHFFALENPNVLVVIAEYQVGEFSIMAWGDYNTPIDSYFLTGTNPAYTTTVATSTIKNYVLNSYQYKYAMFDTAYKSLYNANVCYINHDSFQGNARFEKAPDTSNNFEQVASSVACANDVGCAMPNFSNYYGTTYDYGYNQRSKCPGWSLRPLIPIYLYTTLDGLWSLMGQVEHLYIYHNDGMTPGQTITIAENQYMYFPQWKEDWGTTIANSRNDNMGLLIKL